MPEKQNHVADEELLQAFEDVGAALTGAENGSPPMQVIADRARDIFGAKIVLIIGLSEPLATEMVFMAISGDHPEDVWDMRVPVAGTFTGSVATSGEPRVERDVLTGSETTQRFAKLFGVASAIMVPLEPIGVIVIGSGEPAAYDEDDLGVATVFANLASTAMNLSAMSKLREKERLAAQLHDGAMQLLYAALLQIEQAKSGPLTDVIPRLEDALAHVHDGLAELRLQSLEAAEASMGLFDRLYHLAAQLGRGSRVEVVTKGDDLSPGHFAVSDLARIALEATSNALRHSGSDRVLITCENSTERIMLTIKDWGEGFDFHSREHCLGMANMPKRAERIGADYSLESAPGIGTTVSVEIPLT